MNKVHIEARKKRGLEVATRFKDKIVQREDGIWEVPRSKSASKHYEVDLDPTNPSCTCPDHQETGEKCKHYFAVQEIIGGQAEAVISPHVQSRLRTSTEEKRDWSLYNETQTNEEDEFEPLLWQICQNAREPEYERGRPPIPWSGVRGGLQGLFGEVGASGDAATASRLPRGVSDEARHVQHDLVLLGERGGDRDPRRSHHSEQLGRCSV